MKSLSVAVLGLKLKDTYEISLLVPSDLIVISGGPRTKILMLEKVIHGRSTVRWVVAPTDPPLGTPWSLWQWEKAIDQ